MHIRTVVVGSADCTFAVAAAIEWQPATQFSSSDAFICVQNAQAGEKM